MYIVHATVVTWKCIHLTALCVRCCCCRGISYDKLGHFDAAIQDFNRVLQLEPNNSVAYFNRGSTYDSLGMHDAAIADFSKALELDPGTSSPVHDHTAAAGSGAGSSSTGQHDAFPGQQGLEAAWLQGNTQHWSPGRMGH
jgi:tetratricopeptide (TPR) repeat protein